MKIILNQSIRPLRGPLAAAVFGLLLQGCWINDGPTTTGTTAPSSTVSGVAATGAAIGGGAVTLHCGDGTDYSATTDMSGHWSTRVPTAALPCAVQVTGGMVNGIANTQVFYSLARTGSGTASTSNITPLTDLALAAAVNSAVGDNLDTWYGSGQLRLADVTAGLNVAIGALRTALTDAGYSLPTTAFDPFNAAIAAAGESDPYDLLLEAYKQALTGTYADARDNYVAGTLLPPPSQTPATPDTTLASDQSGARFVTTGTVLGNSETNKLREWSGNGDISVGSVDGTLSEVTLNGPDANSYLNFRDLPDTVGSHDCGFGYSENKANIELGFAVSNGYSSMGTRGVDGFRCSITLTKVGHRSGADYIGVIEGHFDAQLFKTGQDTGLVDSISVTGHFRFGIADVTDADADGVADELDQCSDTPAGTTVDAQGCPVAVASGGSILGNLLKQTLVGDYTLKCSASFGQPVQTFAFTINADGSSVFNGAPLLDAMHPGTITSDGVLTSASGITLKFAPKAANSDYVVLGFKSDGSFYPNSVSTNGTVLQCYFNSGNTAPAGSNQAIEAVKSAVGALARTASLDCTKAGETTTQSLGINSDGSAQIGSESYAADKIFNIADNILFGTQKTGIVTYSDVQFVGGAVSSRTLSLDFDQDLKTTGALYAVGLGPDDGSTCVPHT